MWPPMPALRSIVASVSTSASVALIVKDLVAFPSVTTMLLLMVNPSFNCLLSLKLFVLVPPVTTIPHSSGPLLVAPKLVNGIPTNGASSSKSSSSSLTPYLRIRSSMVISVDISSSWPWLIISSTASADISAAMSSTVA